LSDHSHIQDQAQPRPAFSDADAARIASELFDLNGILTELTSERDQNFLIDADPGEQYVLKIAAAAEHLETLEFQNAALRHLEHRVTSGFIPRLRRTRLGEDIASVKGSDGQSYFVRLITYHPSSLLAEVSPHSPELLRGLGKLLGEIDKAFADFTHPASSRALKWDLQGALWIKDYLNHITTDGGREIVEYFLEQFERRVVAASSSLRKSVVHNDANDYNVLVKLDETGTQRIAGLIDFGDMLQTYTASEVAVAAAYATLDKPDPLGAAAQIVGGYHEVFPFTDRELEVLYPMICMRLAVSVTNSAVQQKLHPENKYLLVSEQPAWELLERLRTIDPSLPHYLFRRACDLPPCSRNATVVDWLARNHDSFAPVVNSAIFSQRSGNVSTQLPSASHAAEQPTPVKFFDLSVGSAEFADPNELADTAAFTAKIFSLMKAMGTDLGIGRYNEPRLLYTSDVFKSSDGTKRTIHIGIDLFMKAGSAVFAPLDGVIHSFANNVAPLDYGPAIIVQHEVDDGRVKFFTLYGHLSEDSLKGLLPGKIVKRGEQIGAIGAPPTNGGWPPHLHFQIICDMLGMRGDFPGVAPADQREVWLSICPDPNMILGIPEQASPSPALTADQIAALRRRHIGPSLSISYRTPLHIVKGWKQYLYDEGGRAYLDAVNNVAHVGHCHPRVVKAAADQMIVLNTNTRYLHENIALFSERLCSTLPDPLSVCFLVCSGSEANELALRLARAHSKGTNIVCIDGAYHGNTSSLIDVSPYKFDGPGGAGAPPHVHKVPMPDVYRGPFKADDLDAGKRYARHVASTIEKIQQDGDQLAAFICESALGCGGQVILPDGYLKEAYRHVREAGGVCIADEVQTGLGRFGSHYWAFETQGVVPDIVTIGKPLGNGHPVAAVITTPEIAASFDNGMEYFNSFGGNPVSCAVGLAVLDVIEEEQLQRNSLEVGGYLKDGLEKLMKHHSLIGDVRGLGLFLGVELVTDRDRFAPAARQASYVVDRLKESSILTSTDGPLHNVIKIKPPIVFSFEDADVLLTALDKILMDTYCTLA
jgi:4-aminobutyrate aminotransferase-like enzyme/Ser/Thr protein kinase RdoA (MazF antagonist)